MSNKSLSSAQTPEEVGSQVAAELRELFLEARARVSLEQNERKRIRDNMAQIRKILLRAVDGYNDHAPPEYQVAVLDRGDRLIFNASGELRLTLTYGVHQLMIDANGEGTKALAPMVLDVWRDKGGLRFRSVPDSPYFPWPVLSEFQFVYSVLRMACNQPFEGQSDC